MPKKDQVQTDLTKDSPGDSMRTVGGMTVTHRGYSGGKKMEKLIGAETVSGPSGVTSGSSE